MRAAQEQKKKQLRYLTIPWITRNQIQRRLPPGGLTPQASTIRQVAELVGQLDPNQTCELQLILQERLAGQACMVPKYFGDGIFEMLL